MLHADEVCFLLWENKDILLSLNHSWKFFEAFPFFTVLKTNELAFHFGIIVSEEMV